MGAAFIAAAARRAERDIIEPLRAAGAVSPATAQPIAPLSGMAGRRFERLISAEVIRQASSGRYFLDEAEFAAYRRRRRTVAITLVVMMIVIGLAVMHWNVNQAR